MLVYHTFEITEVQNIMKITYNDHSYAVMNLVQQIYNCNNITETGCHCGVRLMNINGFAYN